MYKQIETSTQSIVYVSMVRKMVIPVAAPLDVCSSFGSSIVRVMTQLMIGFDKDACCQGDKEAIADHRILQHATKDFPERRFEEQVEIGVPRALN